jgi:autophagy-related protein 13
LSQSPKNADLLGTSPSSQKSASRWSLKSDRDDDKLLKELQFPFATGQSPLGDLAKFYRECFNAPPLQGFNDSLFDEGETEEQIEDLTKQLEQFETSLENFDTLVTSLCTDEVDNNLNS